MTRQNVVYAKTGRFLFMCNCAAEIVQPIGGPRIIVSCGGFSIVHIRTD